MNARPSIPPPPPTPQSAPRRRAASAAAWSSTDAEEPRHDARERERTPHIPGSATCLCSACHLKVTRFPRRQDGKILLPDPLALKSEQAGASGSFHPPAAVAAAAPVPARVRTRSNVHVDRGRIAQEDRRRGSEASWEDRGEGPSTGGYHPSRSGIPVTTLDGRPHMLDVLPEFEAPRSGDQLPHPASAVAGPTRNRQGSLTDRTRPRRASKPYDAKPSRPEPWPRIAPASQHDTPSTRHGGKAYSGGQQQQHLPTAYEEATSHQTSLGIREIAIADSSALANASRHIRTQGESFYAHAAVHNSRARPSNAVPTPGPSRPSSAHSMQFRNPSLALAPTAHYHRDSTTATTTTNPGSYYTDTGSADPSGAKVTRFNSQPRNPQPEMGTRYNTDSNIKGPSTPPDMGYYEGESSASISNVAGVYGVLPSGLTGPAGEGASSQASSSSISHHHSHHPHHPPQQTQHYPQASPLQEYPPHPLRFQDPLTPQIQAANNAMRAAAAAAMEGKPRAMSSVVNVKWDSERKRRQEYYAEQDEGEEKSRFRHYNKTGCDYDA